MSQPQNFVPLRPEKFSVYDKERCAVQYNWTEDRNITYWHLQMDTAAFQMLDFEILKDYKTPIYNSIWFGERAFAVSGFSEEDHVISNPITPGKKECEQVAVACVIGVPVAV